MTVFCSNPPDDVYLNASHCYVGSRVKLLVIDLNVLSFAPLNEPMQLRLEQEKIVIAICITQLICLLSQSFAKFKRLIRILNY